MLKDVVANDPIERLVGEVDALDVGNDLFVDALVVGESRLVGVESDDVGIRRSIGLTLPAATGFEDTQSHRSAKR